MTQIVKFSASAKANDGRSTFMLRIQLGEYTRRSTADIMILPASGF